MVEGYTDVIGLFEAGVTNAVASLGTALTVQQARLLKRYTQLVYIAYDGDAARPERDDSRPGHPFGGRHRRARESCSRAARIRMSLSAQTGRTRLTR